jgi:hypothetical protein
MIAIFSYTSLKYYTLNPSKSTFQSKQNALPKPAALDRYIKKRYLWEIFCLKIRFLG